LPRVSARRLLLLAAAAGRDVAGHVTLRARYLAFDGSLDNCDKSRCGRGSGGGDVG
jgi:hypothetical protein